MNIKELLFGKKKKFINRKSENYIYLNKAIEFHERFIEARVGLTNGCSDFEINELEEKIGFELPIAYKEYLKFMGNDSNGIFVGSDWFINDVIDNTEWLPKLLEENEISFDLPKNYLVFFCHQGYMCAWFELPKIDENPPIWFFTESENDEPPKLFGNLTDFIIEDMKGLASINVDISEWEK